MKRDPFQKTNAAYGNSQRSQGDWIRDFQFEDGMALPIQILNPPEDLFPDGFPLVRRHWITREEQGRTKWLPPMMCTAGMESTGGHCLICHGKATGQLTADRGNSGANEDLVLPLYDHTQYRAVDGNKYRPLNPAMPLMDPNALKDVITGGLKILYVSEGQYTRVRAEHENLQNECASCGGQMILESLACEECASPAFKAEQMAAMSVDDFNRLRYSPHTCDICGHSGLMDPVRKCRGCGGGTARTIFDTVLYASRTVTVNKKGKPRKNYSFSAAQGHDIVTLDAEELDAFWQKFHRVVTQGPSLAQQNEKLGVEIPKEWLLAQTGSAGAVRSYGS